MKLNFLLIPIVIHFTRNIKKECSIDFFELNNSYLYNEEYFNKLIINSKKIIKKEINYKYLFNLKNSKII